MKTIQKRASKLGWHLDRMSYICGILGVVLPIIGFIARGIGWWLIGDIWLLSTILIAPWLFGILAILTSIGTRSKEASRGRILGVVALLISLFLIWGLVEALHT